MLAAGKMDRRITLQAATVAQDAAGEPVPTWADVATVWARLVGLRGRELIAAQDINLHRVEKKFHIRWRADVSNQMRVLFDGQAYGIQHVAELGRREGLELLVKAPE